MTPRRLDPPSGHPPPDEADTPSGTLDLVALATDICRRYRAEYPDEQERYGDAGVAWCMHDNQHILAWGVADVHAGHLDLLDQVRWLARVLASRDFPLDRLRRNLQIAADVVTERTGDEALAARLLDAANFAAAAAVPRN